MHVAQEMDGTLDWLPRGVVAAADDEGAIDVEANLALLSFGEFDRTMMLAALPLNAVIAMAQTLRLPSDDGDELSVADCIT